MLTIIETHLYMRIGENGRRETPEVGGLVGRIHWNDFPKKALICVCERCGYGRADHRKTVRKRWVVDSLPQRCKGCGSPNWDAPKRKSNAR